jgi:ribosomal-protein-alanine N-acetyltransferase
LHGLAGRYLDNVLEIRPVMPEDADALLQLLGDPEVASWLRSADQAGPFSAAECEAMVVRKVAHWTAHGFGMSLAFRNGSCVGRAIAQHNLVDGRSEVEIGWTVARDLWGQGIGTELGLHALACASGAGFERVVAFTRVDNVASRRVMDKLGLRYERDFTYAGLPAVLYATGAA